MAKTPHRKNLPPGERAITNVGIARTRYVDDFEAADGTRGQFYELIKRVGVRLMLPPGDAPYLVPGQPLTGKYAGGKGTRFQINKASLFTNTSKMPGPSFAIPAGPPAFGGTCMAAALGENVVAARAQLQARLPDVDLKRKRLPVLQGLGDADEREPMVPRRSLTEGVRSSYNGDPAFVCRSCLTADARVAVAGRGLVRIGDLLDVEEFVVWSGKAWRSTRAIYQGMRQVVELRTSWGYDLRLTADHKVLTAAGEMVEAGALAVGDALAFEPEPGSPLKHGAPIVMSVQELSDEEAVYDLLNVGDEHQFVANGLSVSNCYALAGNYNYPSKQVVDMMHLAWIEYELEHGGPQRLGQALAYAIQHANLTRKEGFQPYFRIHDAGDFHSEAYLEAWVVCASLMTHMRFWAPTRQWVFPRWVELLRSAEARVRAAGGWLIIRPSVLRIGDSVPMLPGLSAGSGVDSQYVDPCVWQCPVYSAIVPKAQPDGSIRMEEAVSCLEANCTVCWDQPGIPVTYGAH